MKWMKFKIKTVVEAEDIIISELYDRGLEGAQIEDKVPLSPPWRRSRCSWTSCRRGRRTTESPI